MKRPIGSGLKYAAAAWLMTTLKGKHRKPNCECSATNPKKLPEIAPSGPRAIVEVSLQGRIELASFGSGCFCLWQMHDDFEGLVFRHFSRPTDDELLHILVEVLFTEWKGIEGMKELGDVLGFSTRLPSGLALVAHPCLPHFL